MSAEEENKYLKEENIRLKAKVTEYVGNMPIIKKHYDLLKQQYKTLSVEYDKVKEENEHLKNLIAKYDRDVQKEQELYGNVTQQSLFKSTN